MTHTVCIVGVSGVGKTTFIEKLKTQLDFLHLSAGQIIKSQREFETNNPQEHDLLRKQDIDENQRLLVTGFQKHLDKAQDLIILDGHTVIDTSSELKAIPRDVFTNLGVKAFIYLHDEPYKIDLRRRSDQTRNRPELSITTIEEHQNFAIKVTAELARQMQIPVLSVTSTQLEIVRYFLHFKQETPDYRT